MMRISIVVLTVVVCCGNLCAETLYLDADGTWKNVASDSQSLYLKDIADAKQLVSEGSPKAAGALEKLTADYPQLKEQGMDLFIEAEVLYADRKFTKAVEKYTTFLDEHPGSDLFDAALSRLFQIGTAFLNGQQKQMLWVFWIDAYDDGAKIMNGIADRTGDAPIAKKALFGVADSYEGRLLFRDAYQTWSDIFSRWPAGLTGRDALEGMARNQYAGYVGPKYEAGTLVSARGYYRQLKDRDPNYAGSVNVDGILVRLDEQLAEKELTVGMYYHRTGSPEGAELYFKEVTEKWPDTSAADRARGMIGSGK
jgi:outer membrane protein assembly factor BamD (BamD/ComL family)